MTPEHLPTEQYEAQLAEKVVRLQSMMAPFSDLVPKCFARRSVIIGCVRSSASGTMAMTCTTSFSINKPKVVSVWIASPPPVNLSTS